MADFKYISSEWDCAQQLLRVKHVGDDTNVVISINNLLTTGLTYVLTRVSKGVYKPSSKVTIGLYEVTYQGALYDEAISVCDITCSKAVQALPSEINLNWKYTNWGGNSWQIQKDTKLNINKKHPINTSEYNEIIVSYSRGICYSSLSKFGTTTHIYDLDTARYRWHGASWHACGIEVYLRSFIVHKITGCVYSYTPLLKLERNDYNLVVTYDNNRGIDYKWNILPGASDFTDLPPKGSKLANGNYCFRIRDNNYIYDPDFVCLTVSGSKLAGPADCDFNFGTEIIVTQDPATCSISVQNNTSEIVTFAHYQLSSSDGRCFGEKTKLLKGFTLNPYASIIINAYPNVYDTLLWAIYKDKCIREMCLKKCFSKTD